MCGLIKQRVQLFNIADEHSYFALSPKKHANSSSAYAAFSDLCTEFLIESKPKSALIVVGYSYLAVIGFSGPHMPLT